MEINSIREEIKMIQFSLVLLVLGLLGLTMALCTEGLAWWRYCFLRGKATAQVTDEVPAAFDTSKGTVLIRNEDGSSNPVESTMDRSVGHAPFYYWLFERGKFQYVLQWEAEGKRWQGHYRYLKKKGIWEVGDSIRLRYRPGKPWIYGVKDETLWRTFLGKCLGNMALIFTGIILIIVAAG